MDCECKHGIPLDWNCNACSDSGYDPRKSEGNMSETKQMEPIVTGQQITPMDMLNMAVSQNADLDKLEKLMALQERWEANEAKKAFISAMSNVQAKTKRIEADSENKQTHSRYASYAALDRVLRPIYTEEGFSLSFGTGETQSENVVRVICDAYHRNGHVVNYHIDMPSDGKGAKGGDVMTKTHATGSAVRYGMRYLLNMIFNVAIGVDDDGNGAGIEYITEGQAADLNALLDEVGADKVKFKAHFKIDKIEELPAKAYKQAVALTEAKRKQPQKKGST